MLHMSDKRKILLHACLVNRFKTRDQIVSHGEKLESHWATSFILDLYVTVVKRLIHLPFDDLVSWESGL